MTVLFAIAVLCLIFILIYGFCQLRHLIVFEREHYPDEWQSDGCPEFFLFGGNFAVSACGLCWLFLTPDWIPRQEQTAHSLRQWRLCAVVWNSGILLLALMARQVYR